MSPNEIIQQRILVCGTGRVGLPMLATIVSKINFPSFAIGVDIRPEALGTCKKSPFKEPGLQEILDTHYVSVFNYKDAYSVIGMTYATHVIITVGTPIDKNHNPSKAQIEGCIQSLFANNLVDSNTLFILRSTVFPGATRWLYHFIHDVYKIAPRIVYAPERIAESKAIQEIYSLPQILGGLHYKDVAEAKRFFLENNICKEVIVTKNVEEAELAKLYSNTFRYVNFALANELAMVADEYGADYNNIVYAVNHNYPRGGLAKAALNVGGYCLTKDWCLLTQKTVLPSLAHKAYEVAEKTPIYYINKYIKNKIIPNVSVVGVLGLAFKPESDNFNDSLSFKAIKVLEEYSAKVVTYDPYIKHPKFGVDTIDELMNKANHLIIMTEHKEFNTITSHPLFYKIGAFIRL